MLTDRKLLILRAIIDDYILTGIPVGSRTLSKRDDLRFSSATIRNEMADLEDDGFLEQPHTSSGRLPSDKAYRLYVDTLMRVSALESDEVSYIRGYFSSQMSAIEQAIRSTAKVISDVTNLTSVVTAPQLAGSHISRVQLVKLSGEKALLVLVFHTGAIKDVMIAMPEDTDPGYLDMVSNLITERVRGLTLAQALPVLQDIMQGDMTTHRDFMNMILDAVKRNAEAETGHKLIFGGTQNIFNHPEYRDIDKAKGFLQLIEAREPLYDLLSRSTGMEFTISIGNENELSELKNMSVVTATYKIGDGKGSIGVIGPTRMNYSKVLSVMHYVGASLSEMLELSDNKDEKG